MTEQGAQKYTVVHTVWYGQYKTSGNLVIKGNFKKVNSDFFFSNWVMYLFCLNFSVLIGFFISSIIYRNIRKMKAVVWNSICNLLTKVMFQNINTNLVNLNSVWNAREVGSNAAQHINGRSVTTAVSGNIFIV